MFHPLLYIPDPHWDRGIRKPNRLLSYDLNITTFLILPELWIDSRELQSTVSADMLEVSTISFDLVIGKNWSCDGPLSGLFKGKPKGEL